MKFSETTRFFIIFLIPLSFLAFTLFSQSSNDFEITNLDMVLDFRNDSLMVVETLNYQVTKPGFRELYRSYTMDGALANMQVLETQCPSGTFFYSQRVGTEFELICRNENTYAPGAYTLQFTYSIPDPYFCEGESCVLHWKVLDSFAAPIDRITVSVQGRIEQWLSTPMPLDVTGVTYSLPGIYSNSLLEFFVVSPRDGKSGGPVVNLADEAKKYQQQATLHTFMLLNGRLIIGLLTLFEFGLILWIFLRLSKEHLTPGMPEVLHYKPGERKPHEMDFLFGRRPGTKIHSNAVDATLLDLARRGYLKIEKDRLTVIKTDNRLDDFEKRLILFYGESGDLTAMKRQMKAMNSFALAGLSRKMDSFLKPTKWVKSKFKLMYDKKGSKLLWLTIGLSFLVGLLLFLIFSMSYSQFFLFVFAQVLLAILTLVFDNFVFGRYSLEGITEKRKWGAFRNLLCDTAQMKKYEPEDLSMWGDWLIFATAFGCAEKVLQRMKVKKVQLPYVPSYGTNFYFYSMLRRSAHSQLAAKTSRAAGSFSGGVGGGFGGGGGGAR
ncbi:MAG: DUF2207 domain-containing protein [Candidatus Altiarchaeota archaeon]|nr:DUF2207 domain-containing protein [Candidatus Altiarchaeota archaeon]